MKAVSGAAPLRINKIAQTLEGKETRVASGRSSILDIVSLLQSSPGSVIPIRSDRTPTSQSGGRISYAVSRYTILSSLLQIERDQYQSFLHAPSEDVAFPIGSLSFDDDILSLLHMFESSNVGYALVSRGDRAYTSTLVTFKDLLGLFNIRVFLSELQAKDVASSPLFSVPIRATIKETVNEMVGRKLRRALISDSQRMVSDKEVFAYLFSGERLKQRLESCPQNLLEGTLEEIETRELMWLDDNLNIGEVARILLCEKEDAILCSRGIVTPWDLVIKPWRLGALQVL
jgi:hypothetical protein